MLGAAGTFRQAVDMVRKGGRVVLLGVPPNHVQEPLPFKYIVHNEIAIYGSRVKCSSMSGHTAPITFGTGKVLQGKGEGIYVLRMNQASGVLNRWYDDRREQPRSYLAFDATQRFLYVVNELKTYQDRPTGTVSAFTVDPATVARAVACPVRSGGGSRKEGAEWPVCLPRQ